MVIDTLMPRWAALFSTWPRLVRWSSVAHAPSENAISTSPNPASAMTCSSRSASALSNGFCHHHRIAGLNRVSGCANWAAESPPAGGCSTSVPVGSSADVSAEVRRSELAVPLGVRPTSDATVTADKPRDKNINCRFLDVVDENIHLQWWFLFA
ncbi:hypothetical protein [Amycolatopsis sp. FDAARGOS 1241]|uniref:hypothetical protein n=1 Tax=Amycolatopsis sp. FDAARGOS 1241 TaxID=2778070 RepID=UPI001EF20A2D|nr:hypothetical protein [Amycolatopsis sp. FDAARGOS 1241]